MLLRAVTVGRLVAAEFSFDTVFDLRLRSTGQWSPGRPARLATVDGLRDWPRDDVFSL